jgi:hypothetical protein
MSTVAFIALCYGGYASPVPLFIPDFIFSLGLNSAGEGDILSMSFLFKFSSSVCYRRTA